MLMRSDPFRELDRFAQQALGTRMRPSVMPMDAYREGDRFVVHFDLPGVDTSSIDLTVEKNVLTVSAERQWQPGENHQVLASERPQGNFSRQLFLGEGLDTEHVEAAYDNGVLTVTIPAPSRPSPARWRSAQAAAPRRSRRPRPRPEPRSHPNMRVGIPRRARRGSPTGVSGHRAVTPPPGRR